MLPDQTPTSPSQPEIQEDFLKQVDLKKLAEEIYKLLVRELRLENERGVLADRDRKGNYAHFR